MLPGSSRILVVDDMVMMRSFVKAHLKQLGYSQFIEADRAQKAYDTIMQNFANKTPIDIVFSDWNMPEMTGMQLLKKIRATPEIKDLPFILVTAEGTPDQPNEQEARFYDSIRKPFNLNALKEKIERLWQTYQNRSTAA